MRLRKFFYRAWVGLALLAAALCALGPVSAYAQPRAGCDPEVMDAIEAKSWLQAQRRVVQNKNFILKPDSVFEYSCFNQFLGFIASEPGTRRFSENWPPYPLWDDVSAVHEETTDFALFHVVTMPMLEYLDANFFHTFLGGRMPDIGGSPPNYGIYDCRAMQAVWEAARCSNFGSQDQDAFFDFPWYQANDPRTVPPEFLCDPDPRIAGAIIESYRGFDPEAPGSMHGDESPVFTLIAENDPVLDGIPYEEDPMVVMEILDMALPGDCALSAVVPTGVWIEIPGQSNFAEHVCSIPACSFDGAACVR